MKIRNLNENTLKMKSLVLYYTILFAVLSAGVFCIFILLGKSFIQYGDGYRQGYFWVSELKHIVSSVFSGNGIPQWSWSRGLGMQYLFKPDPFTLLAALFPMKYLELGISIALLLKLYCGGLAYLVFAKEMHLSNYQCIIGPVCYIFSTWFISVTMIQSSFIFIAFMIPLLMLGIEWIYRGKTPILFIAAVAYFLIRDAYLAYMAAIVAIIFIFLRYFAYYSEFRISEYLKKIGSFIGYGLIGCTISAAFSIQFILATMRASTESSHSGAIALLSSSSFFRTFGKHLISEGLMNGYSYIGIPILAVLVLPVALRKVSLRNTSSLMTAILLAMTAFPFFSKMFNAFSYSTGRWFVYIVFFASWATMEQFDIEKLRSRTNMKIMIIWLIVLAVWTAGFNAAGILPLSIRAAAFIGLNLAAGAALLFVIGAGKSDRITVGHRQIGTILITCLTLVVGWSMMFYLYQDKFISIGEVNDKLEVATQRAGAELSNDEFFRVDQVDWLNFHGEMQLPDNENLWFETKSIYGYDSFLPARQFEFNRLVGNNYGYLKRVYILSNDNRAGLDFLYGVRYFLGDDARSGQTGSDQYAGYGFAKDKRVDGVNVFRNKYDTGLGFGYESFIPESEFLKLSRTEREQALLQAVVVPDENCEKAKGIRKLSAKDIDTDIADVPFEITKTDGVEIKNGKIIAQKPDASFSVSLSDVENSQLIVSFDDLRKTTRSSIKIWCSDGSITKDVRTDISNQSLPDVHDFDFNMGYHEKFSGDLKITIEKAGEYTFDRMYISAMNMSNYDRFAQKRIAEKFNIRNYDSHHAEGSIDMKRDGIAYFSIPQYSNWDIYVDGQKTERIDDLNIAFTGVRVPEGHHEIMLKYNNISMKYGIVASVLGLILAVLCEILYRRRKKSC